MNQYIHFQVSVSSECLLIMFFFSIMYCTIYSIISYLNPRMLDYNQQADTSILQYGSQ